MILPLTPCNTSYRGTITDSAKLKQVLSILPKKDVSEFNILRNKIADIKDGKVYDFYIEKYLKSSVESVKYIGLRLNIRKKRYVEISRGIFETNIRSKTKKFRNSFENAIINPLKEIYKL